VPSSKVIQDAIEDCYIYKNLEKSRKRGDIEMRDMYKALKEKYDMPVSNIKARYNRTRKLVEMFNIPK